MRVFYLRFTLLFSILLFALALGVDVFQHKKTTPPFSCISGLTMMHGDFIIAGRYFFSFYDEHGVVRINGKSIENGKENIISRQIFFSFIREGDEYILKSEQVEKMSQERGDNAEIQHHFPNFFSLPGRQFSLTIQHDRSDSLVFTYAGVPAFYCNRLSKKVWIN